MAAPQMGYQMRSFGRWLRKLGQSLDKTGLEMMGKEGYRETRELTGMALQNCS